MATDNKKYNANDLIKCKSIANGELLFVGEKSKILYRWSDYGDVEEVEYQDLLYAARMRSKTLLLPRIIVLDNEFVKQNKELDKLYKSMHGYDDLIKLLNLDINSFKVALTTLPEGVRDALKGLASTMIANGSLDSIKKIKALDEAFGTQLLLTLADE